jgi:hypothetical protein
MSSLIINSAGMHKIANVDVDVKYRHPGNVIAYISVAFEMYRDGINFFAVPVTCEENMRFTNLPQEFSFRFKNEKLSISLPGLEEVVEEIVGKLHPLGLIKVPVHHSKNMSFNSTETS